MSVIKFNNLQEFLIALEAGKIETPQFVSLRRYKNKNGEVSNYLINLGTHYGKTLQEDLATLNFLTADDFNFPAVAEPLKYDAYDNVHATLTANTDKNKNNHTPASLRNSELYKTITPNIKKHKEATRSKEKPGIREGKINAEKLMESKNINEFNTDINKK